MKTRIFGVYCEGLRACVCAALESTTVNAEYPDSYSTLGLTGVRANLAESQGRTTMGEGLLERPEQKQQEGQDIESELDVGYPIAEFDGTTVLCRVCGDKASGFHYGVHSCEGCKGFFRRSIQQKIQYRPCTKNQQCSILRMNRNRCQYCRLKKCIAVGMSRDAVRFGRVPKREKAKILAAMQKVNAYSQEKALTAELEDEHKLLSTIIRAHEETCDYTREKVAPLLERARTQPVFTHCPPQLACPLNPVPHSQETGMYEDFSQRFSPAIRGVVDFAKTIPGFSLLVQDDKVTLLKAGVFEVLLVRLACMFDSQTNSMICLNGQVLRRESLHSASNARFLLDSMFDFAERLNALRLRDSELGLFCAVVVIASDRPGLRNTELVQKIQSKLMNVLRRHITAHHPENPDIFDELMKKIPDLRTLNTLHCEKLLAYKMDPKDKQNNESEHSQVAPLANGGPNGLPPGHCLGPVIPDQWYQFAAAVATSQHPLNGDDDNRSPSPGQQSQLSGSSAGSAEWGNSSDSKDGHEPFGSPRSVASSGISVEDSMAKSPLRSSSAKSYESEAYCPAEMLQFQQVACGRKRPRELTPPPANDHSSGDEAYATESPVKAAANGRSPETCPMNFRRIDSPTDSGVESGKEHGTTSTPTASVCSSPRSSLEEKVKDVSDSEVTDKPESIDDMPVLKRALQAPPLINTNMLMDEAYRHHKKFRAARKDSSDSAPVSPPVSVVTSCVNGVSLASSHSTLVKTLEQAPRYMNEQQLKRTDLIHNIIMQTEAVPSPNAGWPQGHRPEAGIPPPGNVRVSPPQSVSSHVSAPVSVPATLTVSNSNNNFVHSVPQTSVNGPTTYVHAPSNGSPVAKNVIVCPPGYYISNPGEGVAIATFSNSPVNSWHFMSPSQSTVPCTATTVTVATSQLQGGRTSFISGGQQQPSPTSATLTVPQQQQQQHMAPPVSAPMMSVSPQPVTHHRVVYDPRSPASRATSPLVIRTPPPVHGVPHLSPNLPVSDMQTDAADTQPLNLSKRDTSSQPSAVKVES